MSAYPGLGTKHIGLLAEVDGMTNSPIVFEPPGYSFWTLSHIVNLFRDKRQKNLAGYLMMTETDLLKSSIPPSSNGANDGCGPGLV